MVSAGKRVLFIVENLPCPFDRRVWHEAATLRDEGFTVSVICPTAPGYEKRFEVVNDIHIYRHPLPVEGDGRLGYATEYGVALFWELVLGFRVLFTRGFDVIHACNPPDLIFLVGGFFKLFFRRRFLFDHHDITPELYVAKFGRRDVMYRMLLLAERLTFRTAGVSIATNESYRRIAVERGGMDPDRVFVVRSGPKLERMKLMDPVPALKQGKQHLVAYVGVMGKQEGIDYLLRAAKYMVEERGRDDVHFGLVGGGTELENLKRYATELGVDHVVTFTGRVPDQDMLEMLNTADVCVNPDVANEMNDKSTMNKIMEYMALGKPIVQFDLTEGRVSAQEASLYANSNDAVDLAEKIIELLDDPDRRQRMGVFGRERVINELQWKFEKPKLLAAYERLFSS